MEKQKLNTTGLFTVNCLRVAANGIGLGEVAEPKSQIEKLNLIIKNKC